MQSSVAVEGIVMIAKLVIASVLVASSVSGSALENLRGADGSTSQWPHMHQCTLDAVSNFTVTNTGGVATGTLRVAGEITASRIDLRVTGAPGGSPTITAHAINTKGTGANSGRSGVTNQPNSGALSCEATDMASATLPLCTREKPCRSISSGPSQSPRSEIKDA